MSDQSSYGGPDASRRSATRVVATAAAIQGTSILPLFLTGALGVQLGSEMGFGPSALGTAAGGFVLARAVGSIPLGRLVDRLGSIRSMRLSAAGSGLASAGIATLARSWWMLALLLLFAGAVQAITQPAVNRFVIRSVTATRLGVAFGVKQSGPPTAVILAGLAVPTIALTLGWRWAYVGAALLAVAAFAAIPSRIPQPSVVTADRPPDPPARPRRASMGLEMVMLGMALGLAATNTLQTFVVGSAIDAGIAPGLAGGLLAAGGVIAIVSRVAGGAYVDRKGSGYFEFAGWMLAAGSLGYLLLASGVPGLYVVGVALAYGGSWGVNGILFMAVVRHNPRAPAAVSGQVIAVGSIGGFLGPPVFGLVAEAVGYGAAWVMTAAWTLVAALSIVRSRAAREAAQRSSS